MAEQSEEKNANQMEYRKLGNTGLRVSILGIGTMSFNNLEQAKGLMAAARKLGINFFDNAELYGEPLGNAEILFGKALKELQSEEPITWRRSDLVITTKLFFGPNPNAKSNSPTVEYGKNERGTSRKHLMEGIDASLKRMQLDYVDVLYAHRWDANTPMLETIKGFTDIIRQGKAFYWGTSMWPAVKLVEAHYLAKLHNLEPPVTEQPLYNMLARQYVEKEFVPVFEAPFSMATTVWSPLDAGILTGKYLKEVPEDSRFAGDRLKKWWGKYYENEEKNKKVAKLKEIADELKVSLVNLAIAWVIKNPNVTVCLLGGSKPHQIEQNGGSLAVKELLTDEVMERIEKVLENKPSLDMYLWRNYG